MAEIDIILNPIDLAGDKAWCLLLHAYRWLRWSLWDYWSHLR